MTTVANMISSSLVYCFDVSVEVTSLTESVTASGAYMSSLFMVDDSHMCAEAASLCELLAAGADVGVGDAAAGAVQDQQGEGGDALLEAEGVQAGRWDTDRHHGGAQRLGGVRDGVDLHVGASACSTRNTDSTTSGKMKHEAALMWRLERQIGIPG